MSDLDDKLKNHYASLSDIKLANALSEEIPAEQRQFAENEFVSRLNDKRTVLPEFLNQSERARGMRLTFSRFNDGELSRYLLATKSQSDKQMLIDEQDRRRANTYRNGRGLAPLEIPPMNPRENVTSAGVALSFCKWSFWLAFLLGIIGVTAVANRKDIAAAIVTIPITTLVLGSFLACWRGLRKNYKEAGYLAIVLVVFLWLTILFVFNAGDSLPIRSGTLKGLAYLVGHGIWGLFAVLSVLSALTERRLVSMFDDANEIVSK